MSEEKKAAAVLLPRQGCPTPGNAVARLRFWLNFIPIPDLRSFRACNQEWRGQHVLFQRGYLV
jgi:hypothetical protein